jgi:hypothetical protein
MFGEDSGELNQQFVFNLQAVFNLREGFNENSKPIILKVFFSKILAPGFLNWQAV